MRILLTGGQGFIGQAFLKHLPRSYQVLSIVRTTRPLHPFSNVKEVTCSLSEIKEIERDIIEFKPSCCVHLAWNGLPDYSAERCRQNLNDSMRLFETMTRVGVKHVVVSGSCWEYGATIGAAHESLIPRDLSIFAATKRAIHSILDAIARQESLSYCWARVFFAYGPGQRRNSLIPHLIHESLCGNPLTMKNPSAAHDFIYIDDVAQAFISLIDPLIPSGAYNIGTGVPHSVLYVADTVANISRSDIGAHPLTCSTESGGMWADTRKILANTNWRPKVALQLGIRSTFEAIRSTHYSTGIRKT